MNGHAGASCYCRQIGKKSVDNFPNCAHFFACPSSRPVRPAPDSSFAYLFMQRPATRPKGKLIYFWFVFFFTWRCTCQGGRSSFQLQTIQIEMFRRQKAATRCWRKNQSWPFLSQFPAKKSGLCTEPVVFVRKGVSQF